MDINEICKLSKEEVEKLCIEDKFKLAELIHKINIMVAVSSTLCLSLLVKNGKLNKDEKSPEFREVMKAIVREGISESVMLFQENKEAFEMMYNEAYDEYKQIMNKMESKEYDNE